MAFSYFSSKMESNEEECICKTFIFRLTDKHALVFRSFYGITLLLRILIVAAQISKVVIKYFTRVYVQLF